MRISLVLAAALLGFAADPAQAQADNCPGCVSIRVGRPLVVRGPSAPKGDQADAPLSVIKLRDGRFRAFTGNTIAYAVDGDTPWALGGPARAVMGPGPKGSLSECGNWITSVVPDGGKLIGLVHNEQACNYKDNQTHKSMSIGVSNDEGLSWNVLGPFITGVDAPQKGKDSGEGDCTAVNGNDGHLYAYCFRISDWRTIVARAPLSDPAPPRWFKWDGSGWKAPGLAGVAAALPPLVGNSASYWMPGKRFLTLATRGSIRLSLGAEPTRFTTLEEPLILYDSDSWKRPGPSDLYGYPSLIGENGFNQLSEHFFLSYMYLPPGADFDQRFIVMHDVWMKPTKSMAAPQVGVALSRWRRADGLLWTTSGPAIEDGNRLAYTHEKTLGFLMTANPPAPSVKLAECAGPSSDRPDYLLTEDGSCAREGFRRLRSSGFAYREPRPGTIPLYRCVAPKGFHFASNRSDCENEGVAERLLGHVLAD
ncbi:MAG: hypothetical protein AB7K04_05595 [Pseudorhodoplanes sp.]